MSLMDLRLFRKRSPEDRRRGLEPPSANILAILADLRWQSALYREEGLSSLDRIIFLGLRVVQRLAYNAGWFWGGRGK